MAKSSWIGVILPFAVVYALAGAVVLAYYPNLSKYSKVHGPPTAATVIR